ncbi:MAG: glycosyltransferase family 2 protein [Hamadaea sp.]|nr:glycosyltransferase family 2 protein [Hamadaea sp.]
MTPAPRIAVVIVTYNSGDVLASCLAALERSQGIVLTSVVVADNASHDDSVAIAEHTALPVTVVKLGSNLGYAAAINAATAGLDGHDALLVLNPDCVVRPDALAALAAGLRRESCGMTVPRLVNPDGSLQPSLRRTPTVGRALGEALLGRRAARVPLFAELITDPRDYAAPAPFAWATGAAMLISAEAARDLGPWDESFLLYSEETEYALRGRDRGWTLWYEPAAEVLHVGGAQQRNPTLNALSVVNRVRLYRRRHGVLASAAYYLAVLTGETLRAAAGRRVSWAAVQWLVLPSRRLRALPQ